MRKKELRLVVTFYTTTDAIMMEKTCKKRQIGGRLIPVPRDISAGCGLAWMGELSQRAELMEALTFAAIDMEEMHECLL